MLGILLALYSLILKTAYWGKFLNIIILQMKKQAYEG